MSNLQDLFKSAVRKAKENGYTQSALSEFAGVSRGSLTGMISTGKGMGFESIAKVARAGGLPEKDQIELLWALVEERSEAAGESSRALIEGIRKLMKTLPKGQMWKLKRITVSVYLSDPPTFIE